MKKSWIFIHPFCKFWEYIIKDVYNMGDQIFEWLVNYCAGTLNSTDKKSLRDWLEASSENREIFEKYLRIVKLHRMAEGEQKIDDRQAWTMLYGKLQKRKSLRLTHRWLTAAASVLIIAGLGLGIMLKKQPVQTSFPVAQIFPGSTKATLVLANGLQIDLTNEELKEVKEQGVLVKNDSLVGLQYDRTNFVIEQPVSHTIKVPTAGEYHFTLSDGTKVWINSESELTFPVSFVGNKREVYVKGEVYFEVEHDEAHPFIVHTNNVTVQVLGTKFNIAAYDENGQVVTTLIQGAVNVAYGEQQQLLHPGEQAIADLQNLTIKSQKVDADRFVSWIKGVFEYENMSLEEIAVQLARWYDVDFVFSASVFKERRFTGVVKKYEMLNDVLKIIEKTTNVCFLINGKEIAVQEAIR